MDGGKSCGGKIFPFWIPCVAGPLSYRHCQTGRFPHCSVAEFETTWIARSAMSCRDFITNRFYYLLTGSFYSSNPFQHGAGSLALFKTNAPLRIHASGDDICCRLSYESSRYQFPSFCCPSCPLRWSSFFPSQNSIISTLMWFPNVRGCNYLLSALGGQSALRSGSEGYGL